MGVTHRMLCPSPPPPNSYVPILTPYGMAFGGRVFGRDCEVGALRNGVTAFIKETKRVSSPLPPCEDSAKRRVGS